MVLLAIVVGGVALFGAVATFLTLRAIWILLGEVGDHLKVLHVAVNGLEASVIPEIQQARESSDAALVQIQGLIRAMEEVKSGPPVESDGEKDARKAAFGRIVMARDLFSKMEADSLAEYEKMVNRG